MINRLLPAAIAVAALLSLPACKKDKSVTPAEPVCHISKITASDSSFMTITYDSEFRISKTTNPDEIRNYVYNGSVMTITRIDPSDNSVYGIDVVTLNAAGLATSVEQRDENNMPLDTTIYEYDANNQLTSVKNDGAVTAIYTWSNGNLQSDASLGGNNSYTYYTDKTEREGDYLQLFQLILFGYRIIDNANLIKSLTADSNVSNFVYDFDAKGKITKITTTNGTGAPESFTYEYICR